MGPLLGAGGMGKVHRARDTQLGRDVAIKLLPDIYADDPESVHRLLQEARAAAALHHPGVLAVYDVGMHEGRPYIVTELLEGVTLRERVESGPIPVATVIRSSTEIALALDAAHNQGIIHRDIKPENVFVTKTDSIKILDFGVAKLSLPQQAGQSVLEMTHAGTLPNLVVGTLGYMRRSRRARRPSISAPTSSRSAASCSRCWNGAPRL
jgi:serine/threonine protein kinase